MYTIDAGDNAVLAVVIETHARRIFNQSQHVSLLKLEFLKRILK